MDDFQLVTCVGYYTDPTAIVPDHDPGVTAPCVFCGEPWTDDTVRTVSLASLGGKISLFYRGHRACFDAASDADKSGLDARVLRVFYVASGILDDVEAK